MILALDLGTHTGWAVHSGTQILRSGVWDLTPRENPSPPAERPARFVVKLREAIEESRCDAIAYEAINNLRGLAAVRVYMQLEAVVLLEAHYRGLPLLPVSPAAVKKAATGKGNADKTAMAVAAARRWPDFVPAREDEVDARFVAEAAVRGDVAVKRPRKARRLAA